MVDMVPNMELDDATRDELAGFLARRFPSAEARARLSRTAGLVVEPDEDEGPARTAWIALLVLADQRGALAQLADAACAEAPDDLNLAEARTLLRGAPTRSAGGRGGAVALLGGALTLLLVGAGAAGALWMARGGEVPALRPVTEARVQQVPAVVAAPVVVAVASAPVAPAPVAPAVDEPLPDEPARAAVLPAPAASTSSPRNTAWPACQGAPGVIMGWWYAGTSAPGAQGATISLRSSVNVRADYPRQDNGYSMRGRVLCSLSAGTAQRLSNAPVDIGRGHWWVPVAGGDLE